MSKEINDLLYTARWNIGEAIKKQDYHGQNLSNAVDLIAEAQANSATEEPDRPNKTDEEIDEIEKDKGYDIPKIVKVPGVKYKKRGRYKTQSGKAKGLLTHYTVSGGSEKSAIAIVKYLAKKGLGAIVISHDGVGYIPEDLDILKDVVYHAGTSSWKGSKGVSAYCIGLEFCSWGKLDSKTRSRAHAIRTVSAKDNMAAGDYEPFTAAQEKFWWDIHLWMADINPEFDVEWCVGHDEVSPGRKSDPGGSFSMTMPEARKMLASRLK